MTPPVSWEEFSRPPGKFHVPIRKIGVTTLFFFLHCWKHKLFLKWASFLLRHFMYCLYAPWDGAGPASYAAQSVVGGPAADRCEGKTWTKLTCDLLLGKAKKACEPILLNSKEAAFLLYLPKRLILIPSKGTHLWPQQTKHYDPSQAMLTAT